MKGKGNTEDFCFELARYGDPGVLNILEIQQKLEIILKAAKVEAMFIDMLATANAWPRFRLKVNSKKASKYIVIFYKVLPKYLSYLASDPDSTVNFCTPQDLSAN